MQHTHIDGIKRIECNKCELCMRSLNVFFSIRNPIWRLENCLRLLWKINCAQDFYPVRAEVKAPAEKKNAPTCYTAAQPQRLKSSSK